MPSLVTAAVNAAVKPWVQKNQHGNGFRFDLVAVQFFKDDAPFGEGVVDASGLFGAVQPAAGPSASGNEAIPGFMFGAVTAGRGAPAGLPRALRPPRAGSRT